MKLTETRAKQLAIAISDELYGDVRPQEVNAICRVLDQFHLVKHDKMAHYEVEGQMDLVSDFPEYCPDTAAEEEEDVRHI
jgi:hypothetical protein